MNATNKDMVADAYGMTTYVYLDIETIPTQNPATIVALHDGVKPPGNLKKQDTIDAWWAEQGAAARAKAVADTSFDGGYGHVCTIAWAKNDGPVQVRHARTIAEETAILALFFGALDPYHSQTVVGHHVAGFDLPFLRKRCVVLGIAMPANLPRDPKPWDKGINDTMAMWAGARDTIGLDRLCGILGIPGKGGMDGSHVAQAWADERHDEIAAYCAADVERTRAVHQRFLAAGW